MSQSNLSTQMLKGILSGCILILLENESLYGYRLNDRLKEFGFDVPMGTIYPLLLSLEKKEFIKGVKQPSKDGPDRKYYHLTATGLEEKEQFILQWNSLKSTVEHLIKGADQYGG